MVMSEGKISSVKDLGHKERAPALVA